MTDLTDREQEFISKIVDWYRTHGLESQIDTEWIMEQMFIGKARVSYLKKSLIAKGIIRAGRGCRLTDTAMESMTQPKSNIRITVPVHLPLLGQVKAGRTKQDDLRAYLIDPHSEAVETRAIPYSRDNQKMFLLEVEGDSMLHENIRPGDYVIVHPFPQNFQPRQRQLIVTRYLPPANEQEAAEAGGFYDGLLEGPTVKYYTYIPGHKRPYRLSWQRDINTSEFTIETTHIDPIGYVIGVYRNLSP